jgi:hypothetical protein
MRLKYLSYRGPLGDEIVLFPALHNHNDFADLLCVPRDTLLGAGFVNLATLTCVGKSLTLNLVARAEDTALLHRHGLPD